MIHTIAPDRQPYVPQGLSRGWNKVSQRNAHHTRRQVDKAAVNAAIAVLVTNAEAAAEARFDAGQAWLDEWSNEVLAERAAEAAAEQANAEEAEAAHALVEADTERNVEIHWLAEAAAGYGDAAPCVNDDGTFETWHGFHLAGAW